MDSDSVDLHIQVRLVVCACACVHVSVQLYLYPADEDCESDEACSEDECQMDQYFLRSLQKDEKPLLSLYGSYWLLQARFYLPDKSVDL